MLDEDPRSPEVSHEEDKDTELILEVVEEENPYSSNS